MNKHQNNEIKNISIKDINNLLDQNTKDKKECDEVTQSSYRNENYYNNDNNWKDNSYKEVLYRDPKTAGFIMEYPHGTIIRQAERNNYYRGENELYSDSVTTLIRRLNEFESNEDKEIYKIIADMRIEEFKRFITTFAHVKNWQQNYGTPIFDALAQHYGLETDWLDITNDFEVALFFATCHFDKKEQKWKPLTKNETEKNENTKYGMIFQCTREHQMIKDIFRDPQEENFGLIDTILPIGFQPFMRCHMQSGYGIKTKSDYSLQQDPHFRKMKFRHNEKLSQDIYEKMDHGKKIYPHEGLTNFNDIIDKIRTTTHFSEEAFNQAFKKNNYFKNKEACREKFFKSNIGKKISIIPGFPLTNISRQRRRRFDKEYADFSIEDEYKIKLMSRLCC